MSTGLEKMIKGIESFLAHDTQKTSKFRVAFSSHGSGLPPLQRIRPIVPVEIVGAEVQAAIVYELFRLDFDKERTLTFERMRPCYLHCLKTLTNEHVRIAESYERIGVTRLLKLGRRGEGH